MAGSDEDFLSRWSRRKQAVRAGAPVEEPPRAADAPEPPPSPARPEEAQPALPPVEELTPESDFSPFMDRKVDPEVRQQALKKLFADPRFNVMDMMDVYVDDYSLPDPIPEAWMSQIAAMAGLGDVPGRLKAEKEARERAEAQAALAESAPEVPAQGAPPASPALGEPSAENDVLADGSQIETPLERAAWGTPEIPAQKQGD